MRAVPMSATQTAAPANPAVRAPDADPALAITRAILGEADHA